MSDAERIREALQSIERNLARMHRNLTWTWLVLMLMLALAGALLVWALLALAGRR